MKKLIKGIVDFREKSLDEYRDRFSGLVSGQSPDTLFVACCDSRVVPNVFASSDPGDLFVLRNVGNIIPVHNPQLACLNRSDVSVESALEFSVNQLNVKDIVVCGHSECGAMQALIEGKDSGQCSCLNYWLDCAASSYDSFKEGRLKRDELSPNNLLSQVNVLQQLENLKTYPLVEERLQRGEIKLHGWWFDIATADVYHYDKNLDEFVVIDEEEAKNMLDDLG